MTEPKEPTEATENTSGAPDTLEVLAFRVPSPVLARLRLRAAMQTTRDDGRPAKPTDVGRAVFCALLDEDDLLAQVMEVGGEGPMRERLAAVVRAGIAAFRAGGAKKP